MTFTRLTSITYKYDTLYNLLDAKRNKTFGEEHNRIQSRLDAVSNEHFRAMALRYALPFRENKVVKDILFKLNQAKNH